MYSKFNYRPLFYAMPLSWNAVLFWLNYGTVALKRNGDVQPSIFMNQLLDTKKGYVNVSSSYLEVKPESMESPHNVFPTAQSSFTLHGLMLIYHLKHTHKKKPSLIQQMMERPLWAWSCREDTDSQDVVLVLKGRVMRKGHVFSWTSEWKEQSKHCRRQNAMGARQREWLIHTVGRWSWASRQVGLGFWQLGKAYPGRGKSLCKGGPWCAGRRII